VSRKTAKEDELRRMLIQVNTDSSIEGEHAGPASRSHAEDTLGCFSEQITHVEVHLSDETGANKVGANDKCCVLEAHVAGRRPIAVSHQTGSLPQAINGAAQKMKRLLDSALRRLSDH
jgi:ribosome-associated translation inhibitor RaiA